MHRICFALLTLALGFPVHADASESALAYQQVALVPADRSLVRPEDGVMLADGTLLIADQVHGLVALAPDGAKRPFGDFAAAGYIHEPPERSAGTEQVERVFQHEFGVNSARPRQSADHVEGPGSTALAGLSQRRH